MQPLLKIQTIPIKIEAQTKRAALRHNPDAPQVEAPRVRAKSVAAPPKIQTEASDASAGLKVPARASSDAAQTKQTSQQDQSSSGSAQNSGEPSDLSSMTAVVADIAASVTSQNANSTPVSVQTAQVAAAAQTASVSFNYQMDADTFDWNANTKPQLEFVPASIEFSVVQYPEVIIEYIGEPIYVPASANPNYVPPPGINETA